MLGDRPTAVIVDMDGTLVDVSSVRQYVMQRPKDFHAFHQGSLDCPPHPEAIEFVERSYAEGHIPIIVTARMWEWFDVTMEWLGKNLTVPFHGPFMRPQGDYRKDYLIKAEIYDRIIEHYDIVGAIDDNPAILKLWRQLGIEVVEMPGWDYYQGAVK